VLRSVTKKVVGVFVRFFVRLFTHQQVILSYSCIVINISTHYQNRRLQHQPWFAPHYAAFDWTFALIRARLIHFSAKPIHRWTICKATFAHALQNFKFLFHSLDLHQLLWQPFLPSNFIFKNLFNIYLSYSLYPLQSFLFFKENKGFHSIRTKTTCQIYTISFF
jgi:hypothetical protein